MTDTVFQISVSELYAYEYINPDIIATAVELGIAQPIGGHTVNDWVFDTNDAHWLKKAVRLSQDLEIDWVAVTVVIDLLKQKDQLERENARLQTRLKRFI